MPSMPNAPIQYVHTSRTNSCVHVLVKFRSCRPGKVPPNVPVNGQSPGFWYKYLYQNPGDCPFTGTFGGTFPGLQDLNFTNTCTQEFVRDVCTYWIGAFGIDGIRFDNTVNYDVPGDARGIPDLLQDIASHNSTHAIENFSLTLEHISMDAISLVNSTRATSYW